MQAIRNFFRMLRKSVGNRDDILLVLPDQLFPYVDVEEVTENTTAEDFVSSAMREDAKEFTIVMPFESFPGQDHKTTIYAVRKNLLDNIIEAASKEGIPLSSIEPASLAAVRSMMRWREEHIFFECYIGHPIVLYSYSPLGGIFRMETQYTPEQFLSLSGDNFLGALEDTLNVRNVNAEHSFETYNDDIKLTILYADRNLLSVPSLKEHAAKPFVFPDFVDDRSGIARAEDFMAVVGTMMQRFPEDFEGYSETCPPFLHIRPGNVLPEEVRINTRVSQWQKTLKEFLSRAAVFLALACAAEGAGIFYYSSFEVPPTARAEYEAAKKSESAIDKELRVIEQAKLEHEAPFTALEELVASKQDSVHFTRFVVNDSGDDKWVNLDVFAADPVMFQDYIAALRTNPTFNNVSLTNINRDEGSGYVRGSFVIGKGKGNGKEPGGKPSPKAKDAPKAKEPEGKGGQEK